MELLTIDQTAKTLQVSHATVRRLCQEDAGFPAVRIRGQIRIEAKKLERWVAANPARRESAA